MGRERIGTGRFPPPGGREAIISFKHRGRSPDPSKTHPGHGAMVTVLAGGNSVTVTKDSGDSGGQSALHPGALPQAAAAGAPWRGARPFDGRPGASRLFGGRRRAACPRCRCAG
jgi:hypothetical protein